MAFKLHLKLFLLLAGLSVVSLLVNIWHIVHTSRQDCSTCTVVSVRDGSLMETGQRKMNPHNSDRSRAPLFSRTIFYRSPNITKSPNRPRTNSTETIKVSKGARQPGQQKKITILKEVRTTGRQKTSQTPSGIRSPGQQECADSFRQEFVEGQNFLCYIPLSRLGNQMFLYASAYGLAAHLNRTLVIGESQVAEYFSVTAKIVKDYKCVIKGTRRVLAKWNCAYDESMMKLPSGKNLCVGKHLQSYKYFEKVGREVRKELTFRKEYRDNATRIIDKAIELYKHRRKITKASFRPVLVGVHVRRGDMFKHHYGFDVATPLYMDKATKYFRTKYGQVLFLVCSNDMGWSKKHVQGDDVIYIEKNHFSIDMAVLVSCDHTLSTVGTFSWWAGYLAGGDTLYYQWPAREGTEHRSHFSQNYTDFFPSSWIGMR